MENLSDFAEGGAEASQPDWISSLNLRQGFVPTVHVAASQPSLARPDTACDLAAQLAEAHAAGVAEGKAAIEAQIEETARNAIQLGEALQRLDTATNSALRQRLADTVISLCEQMIEPHLIDREALSRRCSKALGWAENTASQLTLHLHPDDLAMLENPQEAIWTLSANSELPRGTIQLESPDGFVTDGPDSWRRAISQALAS